MRPGFMLPFAKWANNAIWQYTFSQTIDGPHPILNSQPCEELDLGRIASLPNRMLHRGIGWSPRIMPCRRKPLSSGHYSYASKQCHTPRGRQGGMMWKVPKVNEFVDMCPWEIGCEFDFADPSILLERLAQLPIFSCGRLYGCGVQSLLAYTH